MKKGKLLLGLLGLLTISLIFAGCSNTKEDQGADVPKNSAFAQAEADLLEALAPLPKKDTNVRIGVIESTLSNPFWLTMKDGYEAAAKEYGVTVDVLATETEDDIVGQLNIMNDLLVKKYDALAISPLTEQNLIPGIVAANKVNVKVVAVGNGVNEEALKKENGSIAAFITSDFKLQGAMGADYIIEKTNGKGKVAVIEGIPGATQSEARKNGAVESFKAANMDIVGIQTANFDRQEAYDVTVALIEANPDLVGITCGNDVMALGAVKALKDKGKKDDVLVVGVDFIEEAKTSIETGELNASVAMSPFLFGKAGVLASLKALEGHDFSESVIWTPLQLVTKDNVGTMDGWK